ncbi:hypothetical protein LXL04_024145 [Taraxacum kok-saghyz]
MNLDEVSFWYGRRNGCKGKMGFEERTPLTIAAVYRSTELLLEASADPDLIVGIDYKPVDLIARGIKSSKRKALEMLLRGFSVEETEETDTETISSKSNQQTNQE